jgi:hypothetical protein
MGTPLAVSLVVLAILLGAGFAFDGGGEADAAGGIPASEVPAIARRVEQLRGLRFTRLPVPQQVTPAQAQREGLEDLDRSYPPARRHADEEVLKLLGLLEPRVDLRKISESVYGSQVAGYYDPRSGRLRIVEGAQTSDRLLGEVTLAHELNHALEDQRFDLKLDESDTSDDEGLAKLALIEGTATTLMTRYLTREFSAGDALGSLMASLGQDTGDLPPFLQDQLLFPYTGGEAFVERLYELGPDDWTVVNAALRFRPPASTEQVLHPDAYIRVEKPLRVRIAAKPLLGAGWRRLVGGTWGEWATSELVGNADAAAGWGGDAYELWQREGGACAAPCSGRDALIMRWRWDSARDEREFEAALREWVGRRASSSPARVASRGGQVALVLAPTLELADRLARER